MPVTRSRVLVRRGALLALALLVAVLAAQVPMAAPQDQKTLDNLMAAHNGESNAHAKYVEFAKKADQEGFGGAAALFRAAAQAEQIHAGNHADVIKKLGGTPKAEIKLPAIGSTADNLKAAIEGETYERDTMYPAFIKQARQERNKDALRSFNFAIAAETEHAKLYTAALSALAKGGAATPYYVCTVCGYTVAKIDFKKCPSCYQPVHKYVEVR